MNTSKVNSPLSARIVHRTASYWNVRHGCVTTLDDAHNAIVCGACEYTVHLPSRFGLDYAEEVRRTHLKTVHCDGLISGRVVLTVEMERAG